MMRRVTLLFPALLFALPLGAQGTVLQASAPQRISLSALAMKAPAATTIEQAEQEGAAWPRLAAGSTQPPGGVEREFKERVPRSCASVIGPDRQMRSGEFVIGGQVGGPQERQLYAGREGKVWWIPSHPSTRDTLVVRARLIGGAPADTARFVSTNWAVNAVWFYASGYRLPTPGQWLLIATSGPDWGCFMLTVLPDAQFE